MDLRPTRLPLMATLILALSLAACAKKQRHVTAEYLHFNDDGTIRKVERTDAGVGDFPRRATPGAAPGMTK